MFLQHWNPRKYRRLICLSHFDADRTSANDHHRRRESTACAAVIPTCAISGSVKVTRGVKVGTPRVTIAASISPELISATS